MTQDPDLTVSWHDTESEGDQDPIIVLLHSPALGPASWAPVAGRLRAAGHQVRVPSLLCVTDPPYWARAVSPVRDTLEGVHWNRKIVLVAHSNAGLLVPEIAVGLEHHTAAAVFVDAALPSRSGGSPAAPPDLLALLADLAIDGRLPPWTRWWPAAEVDALFEGAVNRSSVEAGQPTLPLAYYEQTIPVPADWEYFPCAYLAFSEAYAEAAEEAAGRGWRTEWLAGGHLNQLVAVGAVAERIAVLGGVGG